MTLKSTPFFITASAAVNCHSNMNKKFQAGDFQMFCVGLTPLSTDFSGNGTPLNENLQWDWGLQNYDVQE